MKVLTLLLCFGLLVPHQGKADVDAIYFQMNLNGEVVDMGSTGTDPSDFSDLLEEEDASEQDDIKEDIEQEEEESFAPVIRGLTKGGGENSFDCASVGGTSQTYVGVTYCCNDEGKVYENGGWSSCAKVPECGCPTDTYKSYKLGENEAYVCCNFDGKKVTSGETGNCYTETATSNLCGCPGNVDGVDVHEIRALSKKNNVLFCCGSNNKRLRNASSFMDDENADCKCSNNVTECTSDTQCTDAGHKWCSITNGDSETGGWCTTQSSCQTECHNNVGLWCAKDNQCMSPCEISQTWDADTCECQNGCSAVHLEACNETDCQTNGGHWCYTSVSTDQNPVQACQATACCQMGMQQGTDGNCYPCPEEGSVDLREGQYFCCKRDKSGYAYSAERMGWYENALICGCPDNEGQEVENKVGVCCSNGYAYDYDEASYSSTDYINECGCPEGGEQHQDICCKDKRPFKNGAYSSEMDFELCGCEGDKIWDTSSKKCVNCLNDGDCPHGYCVIDKTDPTKNVCVECLKSQHCTGKKICDNNHTCVVCPDGETYADGHCYECATNNDCPDYKQYCDGSTHTCNACLPDATQNQSHDSGCSDEKPYCVQTSAGRRCSKCWINQNCPADKPICNVAEGRCEYRECVTDWACTDPDRPRCDRRTGTCVTSGSCAGGNCECDSTKPVWNIYEKRCVNCYDSISADWTDLGCPDDEPSASNIATYSTRGFLGANTKRRICLVNRQYPDGRCVECLADSHCPVGQKCDDYACGCDPGTSYDAELQQCIECNADYGVTDLNKIACPKTKPFCNLETHQCRGCAETQCIDTSTTPFTCVNLSDYDDIQKDSDGLCQKKNLTKKYEKTGCWLTDTEANCIKEVGYNCSWFGGWDNDKRDIKSYELSTGKLRLKYKHSVTVKADSADDCVYGSNLTGELTTVDSDSRAQTCKYYISKQDSRFWQRDSQFKSTVTINPGTYSGVYLKIKDIWCEGMGIRQGSGSVQFNN